MSLFGLDLIGRGISVSLLVCGSSYEPCFMIYVLVYVSVMGRRTVFDALRRWLERRCIVCFLFGWLTVARLFIFIIYNDRKLLFSSLSHTLAFFLSFSVFFFAQNVSLHILHILIFSFLSFFVIGCWTSNRFLCGTVVDIHKWIWMIAYRTRLTPQSITHMLVSGINICLRWSKHKCLMTTLLPNILFYVTIYISWFT